MGETLVHSGREAVRSPGMKAISFPTMFSTVSFFLVYQAAAPFVVVFLHWELFGHQVNLKRMKEKRRSPRSVLLSRPNLIGSIPG